MSCYLLGQRAAVPQARQAVSPPLQPAGRRQTRRRTWTPSLPQVRGQGDQGDQGPHPAWLAWLGHNSSASSNTNT